MTAVKMKEKIGKAVFAAAAIVCTIATIAIFAFLIYKSIPALEKIGVFKFIFGDKWSPDRLDTYDAPLSGTYGIFTMIVGTLVSSCGALLIGGVFGYFTAVFLTFYCRGRAKRVFKTVIQLLAGIPSVVYGFFGIVFLLPILSSFAPNDGSGLLATSLILGVMILPTIVSLSATALEAVPRHYYEGSVAMGSTHSETVFRIMTPAARSGITASLVLGIGRALGETMAVVMVAGNAAAYPKGLFSSFRVITANIVMEMGYAGEVQEDALVATGVVLLLFVLLVNLLFAAISKKSVEKLTRVTASRKKSRPHKRILLGLKERFSALLYRIQAPRIGKAIAIVFGYFSGVILVLIVGFIFAKGLPFLIQNPSVIYGKYEFGGEKITILPAIVTTLLTVVTSLLIALPIGIMTAIFLNEYGRRSNAALRVIRFAIDILAGIPSIVYGLFGMITFVRILGGTSSILAGSLTISMMLLPTIVRSTEESLIAVEDALREGSLALGAGKLRTIFRVVLPSALPGILTAVILSIGRVISESAPFLYTTGSIIASVPNGLMDNGATLAVALYQLSGEGWYMQEAYATAVVLIVIVLLLNLSAELVAARLTKKLKGASNAKS